MSEEDATLMSETLSKSKKAWVEVMMVEELGTNISIIILGIVTSSDESPIKNALVTFLAFVLFGVIPLMPFIGSL